MSSITDLTQDFDAEMKRQQKPVEELVEKPEAQASEELGQASGIEPVSGNWFTRQSIPRKLEIAYATQLGLTVLIGVFAWFGLSAVDNALQVVAPNIVARVAEAIAMTNMLVLGAVVLAIVAGVVGLRHVQRTIASGVVDLNQAMSAMSRGDLDIVIPGQSRADEFGDMARLLEEYRVMAIKHRGRHARELERARSAAFEQKQLHDRHRDTLAGVADKFDRNVGEVVGSVAAAASELQATATAMAANADQSYRQSERVRDALNEASGGVTAAAAASEEFAISISEISRQATTSAELARKASGVALATDQTISELTDRTSEVSKVVELISHIAQRTNLLALNASIEAARGGEAGRGFAVVATEVKELATQTGKATEQVAQQIRAMQDTTDNSVTALRDIAAQIKQLETTSVSIAAAVDQQSNAGRDLAKSIDLAARGAEDVSSNIEQVLEAARATGTVASQVLSSATELEKQATFLRVSAGDFTAEVRKG